MANDAKAIIAELDETKNLSDVMSIFIKVAKKHPNQATKLFNRYVALVKNCTVNATAKQARETVVDKLSYGMKLYKCERLFRRVYKELRVK